MKSSKFAAPYKQQGSALVCALTAILVLSIVGAGVLMSSTTRYNSTSKQVKAWKEALYAAEAGGDLAFAEVRKYALNPGSGSGFASADGWAAPAPSPLPSTFSWNRGYTTSPPTFGENNQLSAKITVDRFGLVPGSTTAGYYRIRSVGLAQVGGLKRTGMDDALEGNSGAHFASGGTARGNGDSLLRKIDFNFDHFISTYGYGDALPSAPATGANGKSGVTMASASVSRRIELVALPIMPIEGAIKTAGAFNGTTVDSYDSKNGAYKGANPAPPYDVDAHDGDVICGGSSFSAGYIYGDVTTNGGNAATNKASGVVDNNVPITIPPATPGIPPIPTLPWTMSAEPGNPSTISPPVRFDANGNQQTTFYYTYTNINNVTVNPLKTANGTPINTTVNIYCTADVNGLVVNEGAIVNIYFKGNMGGKARDYDNFNVDGPVLAWSYFYTDAAARTSATGFVAGDVGKIAYQDGNPGSYWKLTATTPTWAAYTPPSPNVPNSGVNCVQTPTSWTYANAALRTAATGFTAADIDKIAYQSDTSTYYKLTGVGPNTWRAVKPYEASSLVSRAGHNWFYGISPASGSRSINIAPPGDMYAAFYAPGHDFGSNGNPDFYGVMVCKSFTMNGNCTFHFDKQLIGDSAPVDYRVASYVEDIR